jgi:glycosyltransferase involved in cell wall biosynthesis
MMQKHLAMGNIQSVLSAQVSVVIPAYNADKFLVETLTSAVQANPKSVIVVDDGSLDNTLNVAEEFSRTNPSVRVFTKSNAGESSAINFGLNFVETPYVLFLSADDLIDKSLLSKAVQILEKDKSLVAVYPSWRTISGNGEVLSEAKNLTFSISRLVGSLECLPGPGSIIRRSSIRLARNESLRQFPDLEHWLRLSMVGPFIHMPEILASWRTHESNQSKKTYGSQLSFELDIVFETVRSMFADGGSRYLEPAVWDDFLIHWHRLKAIAETRIVGSFRGIPHLYQSWVRYLCVSKPRPQNPWSSLEVIGTLAPPLIWLRDLTRSMRERSKLS